MTGINMPPKLAVIEIIMGVIGVSLIWYGVNWQAAIGVFCIAWYIKTPRNYMRNYD